MSQFETGVRPGSIWGPIAGAILVALLFAFTATRCGLFDLDEGLYAAAASEMVRSGDYLTPRYARQPFLEKPPLLYWCMTAFIRIGVPGELAVRLPSVLAACVVLIMVGISTIRRGGSILTVLGTAVMPLFFGLGCLAYTDMLLTCFLAASLLLLWFSLTGGPPWVRVPMAVCLGLATLAKGPVALVLFVLIAGIVYWRIPEVRHAYRIWWAEAAIVYLLVAAPWYYLIYKAHGAEFFNEFIVRQNLGRFAGGDTAHLAPFYFYLPVLLVGAFPWSLYLPWLAFRSRGDPFQRFCWIWFWVVVLFFSASGSKLPSYILPAFPAIALLLPTVPYEMTVSISPARVWAIPMVAAGVTALVIAIGATAAAARVTEPVADALRVTAIVSVLALVLVTIILRIVRAEIAHCVSPVIIGAGFVLPLALAGLSAYYVETHRDIHVLTRRVRPLVEQGADYVLYRVRPGHPSVMYYLPKQGLAMSDLHATKPHTGRGEVYITLRKHVQELLQLGMVEIDSQGKFVALRSDPFVPRNN